MRRQLSITSFLHKLDHLPNRFRVDFKVCLMIFKFINIEALEYFKFILLRRDTEFERRNRHDYDRTGLRTPPVENVMIKCRSFRNAAPVVWN